jgi:orotate phosphoribosyltransferase
MLRDEVEELKALLMTHSLRKGDFLLASGRRSSYFFDGKKATLAPRESYLVGRIFFDLARAAGAEAVGGLLIGADPIATSVALVSGLEGQPMPGFIVREEQKTHGIKDLIAQGHTQNGSPLIRPGRPVAVVDDVVTTGGSIQKAIDAVETEGCKVVLVAALVDRLQGGRESFERHYRFASVFEADRQGDLSISADVERLLRLPV